MKTINDAFTLVMTDEIYNVYLGSYLQVRMLEKCLNVHISYLAYPPDTQMGKQNI